MTTTERKGRLEGEKSWAGEGVLRKGKGQHPNFVLLSIPSLALSLSLLLLSSFHALSLARPKEREREAGGGETTLKQQHIRHSLPSDPFVFLLVAVVVVVCSSAPNCLTSALTGPSSKWFVAVHVQQSVLAFCFCFCWSYAAVAHTFWRGVAWSSAHIAWSSNERARRAIKATTPERILNGLSSLCLIVAL